MAYQGETNTDGYSNTQYSGPSNTFLVAYLQETLLFYPEVEADRLVGMKVYDKAPPLPLPHNLPIHRQATNSSENRRFIHLAT